MAVKIIGLIIGIMLICSGIFYLSKSKEDPESKKIYTIVTIVGVVIAVLCAILLFK